jgi:two-component system, response regulator YesN
MPIYLSKLTDKMGFQRKTFYKIFLFSVIFSSTVLITITLILYFNFERATIDEIQKKSITGLMQTMNVFSSLNSWLVSSTIQMVSEQSINDLIYSKDLDPFMISRGISRLDSTMASYPILHSIYVYNSKRNEYYSTIHGMEGEKPSDNDLAGILNNIKKYKIYTYIPRKMTVTIQRRILSPYHGTTDVNVITLVAGEMPFNGRSIKGACVINISEEKLGNTFLLPGGNAGGLLVIADKNMTALFHSDVKYFGTDLSGSFYMKKITADGGKSGVFVATNNKVKYLVAYVVHPQMGWTFVSITPYDMIFSGINNLRNFTITVFLLMIMLSIASAFIFTRRIYKPIQSLIFSFNRVKDRLNLNADERIGEFQYFNSIFQNVVNKVNDQDDYIRRRSRNDSGDLLRSIVSGKIQPSEIMDDYQHDIKSFFESKELRLVLISIDRFAIMEKESGKESAGKWFESVSETVSRNIETPHRIVQMEKNAFVIILAETPGILQDTGQLKEQLILIQEAIKGKMKFTVSMAASAVTNESGIPSEYDKLQKNMLEKFKFGNNSFFGEAYAESVHTEYDFPEKKSGQLFDELKLGRSDRVQILLDEILSETAEHTYDDFRLMVMLLSHNALKVINRLEQDTHLSMEEARRMFNNLHLIDTIADVRSIFLDAFSSIIGIVSSFKSKKKNDYIKAIKEYVGNNLFDFSLCPDSLSSVIGFSTNYIRNVFKEETGVSLSDYINDLRIEHGKRLLFETDMTVKDISRSCGFSNYNYFFTFFKKHTGVTPDFYRQKNKKY